MLTGDEWVTFWAAVAEWCRRTQGVERMLRYLSSSRHEAQRAKRARWGNR